MPFILLCCCSSVAEDYVLEFNRTFKLPYTILRFGSLYGPRADNNNGIKKLINSGEDLTKNPRIKISTIHGVKGNERENVVVTTDLAGAAFDEYQKNSDDMNRLFYVACTRTERNLYIIEPQTRKAYNL